MDRAGDSLPYRRPARTGAGDPRGIAVCEAASPSVDRPPWRNRQARAESPLGKHALTAARAPALLRHDLGAGFSRAREEAMHEWHDCGTFPDRPTDALHRAGTYVTDRK